MGTGYLEADVETAARHDLLERLGLLRETATMAVNDLRDAAAADTIGRVGLILPAGRYGPGDLVRRVHHWAEMVTTWTGRLCLALRHQVGEAGLGAAANYSSAVPRQVPRPSVGDLVMPLIECPACGDLALAFDPAGSAACVEWALRRVCHTLQATAKAFATRANGAEWILRTLAPACVTALDRSALRHALDVFGTLDRSAADWLTNCGAALGSAARDLESGELPAFLLSRTGADMVPLRPPCPHLREMYADWSQASGTPTLERCGRWKRPALARPATPYASWTRPVRMAFQFDPPVGLVPPPDFTAAGHALFDPHPLRRFQHDGCGS